MSTNGSIISDGKKIRYKNDCFILYTTVLVIMLLLFATIMQAYVKTKSHKWKRIDFKKLILKIVCAIIYMIIY